jgi:hypothetical protein
LGLWLEAVAKGRSDGFFLRGVPPWKRPRPYMHARHRDVSGGRGGRLRSDAALPTLEDPTLKTLKAILEEIRDTATSTLKRISEAEEPHSMRGIDK